MAPRLGHFLNDNFATLFPRFVMFRVAFVTQWTVLRVPHSFGMFHDTAKIGCHPRVGPIVHIMTPTFGADTLQVCWSNCSRKYITHFLDQGLGECLDDPPTPLDEYNYTGELPGMRYNARGQCRLQFNLTTDSEVGACSAPHEFCSTLWCKSTPRASLTCWIPHRDTPCGRNTCCGTRWSMPL
ncbi:uncharacterized protein Dyak_GE15207 [Drosophila yakuba]|uniref:Peptidase M12B domain-containing protein n=1 Tax=Drosophila yakuba TaxID=7245 RepID=B4IWH6_DROYA|nr:uncharacterized protein Dyak_GE15207 [Drosophila yakuba]